jgi:hypothetical protein
MNNSRGNTVLVSLISTLLIPRVERVTGVKLNNDEVADLIGLAIAGFHYGAVLIERFDCRKSRLKPQEQPT